MKKYICLFFIVLYALFNFCGCSISDTKNIVTNNTMEVNEVSSSQNSEENQLSIDSFVKRYNTTATNKIIITGTFEPQDKSSEHYKTEFRLNAYKNSTAKTGTIANKTIDIIDYSSDTIDTKKNLRIYTTADKSEEMLNILKTTINILDSSILEDEINSTVDDIYEYGSKSFYFGNSISGYISGGKNGPYEIMINYSKYER